MQPLSRPPAAIARRARARPSRSFDELEVRTLLAGDPPPALDRAAELVGPADQVASQVAPGAPLVYRIAPTGSVRLTAEAQAWGAQVRLSLLDGRGRALMQSDGQSRWDARPRVDQHVLAGTYYFEVESLGGAGVASLTVTMDASSEPFRPLPVGATRTNVAASGDFNGDGRLDLATVDGVHPGLGDGTFGTAIPGTAWDVFPGDDDAPPNPSVVAGDFNGDGRADLAVADANADIVQILLGVGDGTFRSPIVVPVGGGPDALVVGDFNGDGRPDLAVADGIDNAVRILQGAGDGTFVSVGDSAAGVWPDALAVGDFNGDGRPDLAAAGYLSGDVTLLVGLGAGRFATGGVTGVGLNPMGLAAGDFDGDGRLDLAVTDSEVETNTGRGDLRILRNDGRGGFVTAATIKPGVLPMGVVARDFNGDGVLDLAVANNYSNGVSILLGEAGGGFRGSSSIPAGAGPMLLIPGDFNGDGRVDLTVGDTDPSTGGVDLAVYLGGGDGTFRTPVSPQAGAGPDEVAAGDFDGDGRPDLAVVDGASNQVAILLGGGDGTFRNAASVTIGEAPNGIAVGDFNGDDVLDLAVPAYESEAGDLIILLGNGDGSFRPQSPILLGGNPRDLVAGDFNGDGVLDLAVNNGGTGVVTILLGGGDGTFRVIDEVAVGVKPRGLVAGDFDGDGRLDLALANFGSTATAAPDADTGGNTVSILRGRGDGTFLVAQTIPIGLRPYGIAAGDFNGDGRLDLAVTEFGPYIPSAEGAGTGGNAVTILGGLGNGLFGVVGVYAAGRGPSVVTAKDFNGDGRLDLAVVNYHSDSISILLGAGGYTFGAGVTLATGSGPTGLATADLDGDGHADLIVTLQDAGDLAVRLGRGDGGFFDPGPNPLTTRHSPVFADLTGDGVPDVAVIDGTGEILFRKGRAGQPGSFAPPLVADPGPRARDIVAIATRGGTLLASLQADSDAVILLKYDGTRFARVGTLVTGQKPSRIVSADLNGDGIADLLVLDHDGGTLSLFLGDSRGGFRPRVVLEGAPGSADPNGLADLELADIDGDGRPEILVADRIAGAVRVLRNRGGGAFGPSVAYRAGSGPYGIGGLDGVSGVSTLEGTVALAAARFTPGGPADLVAVDDGSRTLGRLAGMGGGRIANAVVSPVNLSTWAVRTADLDGDGRDEVITLGSAGLQVYKDDGRGGLALAYAVPDIGDEPEGLAIADLDGDGRPDVLIGTAFGDVLMLKSDGQGRLMVPGPLDRQVTLAVAPGSGPGGPPTFAVAVPGLNVVIAGRGDGKIVVANKGSGLNTPSAVQLPDLNGNHIPDLVVANAGGNNVLIYLGLGGGRYGPELGGGHGFAVGTDPVGITAADLDGDRRPDLIVANRGSNDVSILLNRTLAGGALTFRPGPRLKVGAGPTSTVVADLYGTGRPDIVVSNSASDNVYILRGRGFGSFDAANPTILPTGVAPLAMVLGNFSNRPGQIDLVTVNAGSNSLSFFAGINGGNPVAQSIPSGGQFPIAALALDRGDGLNNLLVANNGDGALALFLAGPGGPTFASAVQRPDLPHPSALALGADGLIFAGTEESDAAIRVSLGLGFGVGTLTSSPPFSGPGAFPTLAGSGAAKSDVTIAVLKPLGELSLVLVATLLSSAGSEASGVLESLGNLPNQPSVGSISGVPGDDEDPDAADEPVSPGPREAGASPLQRLIGGIDEAFARAREEARRGRGAAPARERALDSLIDSWGPAIRALGGPDPAGVRELARAGLQALDAALHSLGSATGGPDAARPAASTARALPVGVASLALAALARPLLDLIRPTDRPRRARV